ncbi:hypothetical protein [Endothiovibrio diazotrophicus]
MERFVPLSDELLYDHPERIPDDGSAVLVPFSLDLRSPPRTKTESEEERRSRLPPRRNGGSGG